MLTIMETQQNMEKQSHGSPIADRMYADRHNIQCDTEAQDALLHDQSHIAVRGHVVAVDFGLLFAIGQ